MTIKGLSGKLKHNIELEVEGDGILFRNISISLTYLYSKLATAFFFWGDKFWPPRRAGGDTGDSN